MSPTSRSPGAVGGEVAADQVRAVDRLLAGDGGALVGAGLHRPQAQLAHQIGDQPDASTRARPG